MRFSPFEQEVWRLRDEKKLSTFDIATLINRKRALDPGPGGLVHESEVQRIIQSIRDRNYIANNRGNVA